MTLLGWGAARAAAHAAATPLAPTEVALGDAAGCTLATPLRAVSPVPGFDCSAMDGYAVGSATGPWRVVGRLVAGDRPGGPLVPGEAVEIATGAPTPPGTFAVLPDEHADRAGEKVDGAGPLPPGRHVRGRGEDVPLGVDLLPAGTAVGPTVVGLAAEVGLETLTVRRRPAVAGLLTGAELVRAGGSGHGLVRDGVGPALPGWVRALGGEPLPVRYVPETGPADLVDAVAAAGADVVVTCGGAGGGPTDQVVPALRELGATLLVDRVDCRPGRPMRLAALPDGRWWVVLPGSPYAGLVAVLTLLGPLLAALTGRPLPTLPTASLHPPTRPPPGSAGERAGSPPGPSGLPAGPAGPVGSPPGLAGFPAGPVGSTTGAGRAGGREAATTRIVPVRWVGGAVEQAGLDRAGQLWGPALADAYAAVPADHRAGDPVPLLTL